MRSAVRALLVGGACAITPSLAAGQWSLNLDPVSGELGGSFDGSWMDVRRPELLQAQRFQEWLQLMVKGSLRDPRVLAFQLSARPLLSQGRFLPRIDTGGDGGLGRGMTGTARLMIFGGAPISGRASFGSSYDVRQRRFGGVVEQASRDWSFVVTDKNPLLPMEVSYGRRARRASSASRPVRIPLNTNEATSTLRLKSENRKTRLVLERLSYRQMTGDVRYVRRLGELNHDFKWGSGSRLLSRLRLVDRSVSREFRRWSWRESAHLRQTPTVSTDLAAMVYRQSTQSGSANQFETRGDVSWLVNGMTLGLEARFRSGNSGSVRHKMIAITPSAAFSYSLPLGAALQASFALGYERHAQGSDGATFSDILQEEHTVGPDRAFQLVRPFADPASLVITSRDDGSFFDEGLDYEVIVNGPFVTVLMLPSGRIEEDTDVLVDYRYDVAPEVSANAMTVTYDLTLSVASLRLYHRRHLQHEFDEVPTEVLSVLRNQDQIVAGVIWSRPIWRVTFTTQAETRINRTSQFDFRSSVLRGTLATQILPRVLVSSSASAHRLGGGTAPYTNFQIQQRLDWRVSARTRLRVNLSRWTWSDTKHDERFLGIGASIERNTPRRRITVAYDRFLWSDGIDRRENRLTIQASQRF